MFLSQKECPLGCPFPQNRDKMITQGHTRGHSSHNEIKYLQ